MRVVVLLLAAVLIVVASTYRKSHSHEWYPSYCCSGDATTGDCKPLDPKRVTALPDGGYEVDGIKIQKEAVQKSMDGRYHACFPSGKVSCFFAPPRDI